MKELLNEAQFSGCLLSYVPLFSLPSPSWLLILTDTNLFSTATLLKIVAEIKNKLPQ